MNPLVRPILGHWPYRGRLHCTFDLERRTPAGLIRSYLHDRDYRGCAIGALSLLRAGLLPGASVRDDQSVEGLASHGGVIGIIIAVWIYSTGDEAQHLVDLDCDGADRLHGGNDPVWEPDESQIYGGPTDLPWGFRFITNIYHDAMRNPFTGTITPYPNL